MELLRPCELGVGMFVTIRYTENRKDRSGMGDVLQIQAINWPYVLVEMRSQCSGNLLKFNRDATAYDFIAITDEWAKAQLGPDWKSLFTLTPTNDDFPHPKAETGCRWWSTAITPSGCPLSFDPERLCRFLHEQSMKATVCPFLTK